MTQRDLAANQDRAGADFRHVDSWIFDLDNTLYRADTGILAQIESRMTEYVMAFLDLPRDQAYARQKALYRTHGTTLNGLMAEHGAQAEPYLHYVHAIDLCRLGPDPNLAAAIQRLPGRRFVLTNGCRHHGARILARLGLAQLFEAVWDIRSLGFCPKPKRAAYAKVVAQAKIGCAQAAMFDDLAPNLVPAHDMGMTTVWVTSAGVADEPRPGESRSGPLPADCAGDIDHQTGDLTEFLQSIRI